jgi:transcriptional regulator with XRE-family HTH domain
VKSESKLIFARIQRLRLQNGWSWDQVSKELGVSKVMLHYVKTGQRSLSDKIIFRLEKVEVFAGLREAQPHVELKVAGRDMLFTHFTKLKRRWLKHPSKRDEITLAIHVLFPDSAEEVLGWLGNNLD